MRAKKGFTLAEVLFTLTITGIVACLTIPALLINIQDSILRVAWRQHYSIVSQATTRIMSDNAGTMRGLCSDWNNNCFRDKYLTYFNTIKSCDKNATLGTNNCWHPNDGSVRYLHGGALTIFDPLTSGAILSNGSLIALMLDSSNCTNPVNTIQTCGYMLIDVNGWKKPNVRGRDIFTVWIMTSGIKPAGISGDVYDTTTCIEGSTDPANTGHMCSLKYLTQ